MAGLLRLLLGLEVLLETKALGWLGLRCARLLELLACGLRADLREECRISPRRLLRQLLLLSRLLLYWLLEFLLLERLRRRRLRLLRLDYWSWLRFFRL